MTARPRHYAKPSAARSHNQRAMIFRPWKKSLLVFLPTPNPRHRRDKIRTCRIVRWDIALAVALVGLPGGDIVTESDIQTAAIGIKCGYQRRLLVRRLPCRVLLTMVARCHH